MWNRWIARAATAAALGWAIAPPSGVEAQEVGVLQPDGTCEGLTLDACPMDAPDMACGDGGAGTCTFTFELGDVYCLPNGAVLCCEDTDECPYDGTSTTPECTEVSAGSGSFLRLCLAPGRYCASAPNLGDVASCHTDAMGNRVRWPSGDCDGDGQPNADDPDPCVRPDGRGHWSGGECKPVPTACRLDESCEVGGVSGTCMETADGAGVRCVPERADGLLYCALEGSVCPAGTEPVSIEGRTSLCLPSTCPDDGLHCVDGSETGAAEYVPFAQGDCDGDGTPNAADATPCSDSAEPADGGATAADAGPAPDVDGGPPGSFDAGAEPTDPSTPLSFNGGGGCVCRAAQSEGRGALPPFALALGLALALAWRRR